jgi:hypothetical protein
MAIPADMDDTLAEAIRRHGGEWRNWIENGDHYLSNERPPIKVNFWHTLITPIQYVRMSILSLMEGTWMHYELEVSQDKILEDKTIDFVAEMMAKRPPTLSQRLEEIAAYCRPSMCDEVRRNLRALAEELRS